MTTEEIDSTEDLEAAELEAPFDPLGALVRFTHLKQIARSPAHYLHSLRVGMQDTDKKRFGRGAHVLCLGGSVTIYEGERRGNKWKDFAKEHAGEEIVTRKEYDAAARIAELVRRHPLAGPLLLGKTEHAVEWSYLGRGCQSRIDSLNPPLLDELKASSNGEPGWFGRNALRLGYHAQLAYYRMACADLGIQIGPCTVCDPVIECQGVHIVCVEMKAPHPITVLRLTERALLDGEKLCRLWMERLLVCEAEYRRGTPLELAFPPYVQSIVDLDSYERVELVFGDEEEAA